MLILNLRSAGCHGFGEPAGSAGAGVDGLPAPLTLLWRGCMLQAFTGRPARGLTNQATRDLQQLQKQLPLSLIGLVSALS